MEISCLLGYKLGKIGYASINILGTLEMDIDLIRIANKNGVTWKNNEFRMMLER